MMYENNMKDSGARKQRKNNVMLKLTSLHSIPTQLGPHDVPMGSNTNLLQPRRGATEKPRAYNVHSSVMTLALQGPILLLCTTNI